MKTLLAIFFLSSMIYSQAFRLSRTDSDSLWQDMKKFDRDIAKEEFTVRYYEKDDMLVYIKTAIPFGNFPNELREKILARIKERDAEN